MLTPNGRVTEGEIRMSIRRALRAAKKAQSEGYGYLRTSGCADHLDAAVSSLEAAVEWMSELKKVHECRLCRKEIYPDEVTVCSGCDEEFCPSCIVDGRICVGCCKDEEI